MRTAASCLLIGMSVAAGCVDPDADLEIEVAIDPKADGSSAYPIGTFEGLGQGETSSVEPDVATLVLMTDRTYYSESECLDCPMAGTKRGSYQLTRSGDLRFIKFHEGGSLVARYRVVALGDNSFELIDVRRDADALSALTTILSPAEQAWCEEASDCGAQHLATPGCDGAWTCGDHACRCPAAPRSCNTNADCGENGFCNFTIEAGCGELDHGTCEPRYDGGCASVLAPVCGCDGRTYAHVCNARWEGGVAVSYEGACR